MTADEARKKIQDIQGWISSSEADFLFNSNLGLNENSLIVDLGTANGYSAALLGCLGCKIITIDNYKDKSQSRYTIQELKEQEIFKELQNIEFIEGESIEVAKTFEDESIDLIFIDADHSFQAVKTDIEAWLPKLKRKGKMFFHDYESYPDVALAVNEAFENGLLEKHGQIESMLYTTKPK